MRRATISQSSSSAFNDLWDKPESHVVPATVPITEMIPAETSTIVFAPALPKASIALAPLLPE